jgi:Putative zincin peptidase
MRFKFGPIPEAEGFMPDESWKPMREPSPWLAQLASLPLGCACFVIFGWLWLRFTIFDQAQLEAPSFLCIGVLLFIPMTVAHELIHALVQPQFGRSAHSILGFWPAKLMFYAHYDGELSRGRFVAILSMPTIMLSVLPLIVSIITGLANAYVAWISTWNVLFACVDMLGVIFPCVQVPPTAVCRNQGWKTYWRLN